MSKDSFKEDYEKLKKIVAWFESDDVDIDKAISKFDDGMKTAEKLKKKLEEAEAKIEELKTKFE